MITKQVNTVPTKTKHIYLTENFHKGKALSPKIEIRHKNGSMMFQGDINSGKRTGHCKIYYENSRVQYAGLFANDEFHGDNICLYNPDGTVKFKGSMRNGLRSGDCTEYFDKSGKPKYEATFDGDKLDGPDIREYYDNGKLLFKGGYCQNLRTGPGVEYYSNGKIRYQGEFVAGLYHGKQIRILGENGEAEYSGDCVSGKYVLGVGKIYHSNQN
jgi:antitoxin component YwqK of YwqJK toxin-antitoxin module